MLRCQLSMRCVKEIRPRIVEPSQRRRCRRVGGRALQRILPPQASVSTKPDKMLSPQAPPADEWEKRREKALEQARNAYRDSCSRKMARPPHDISPENNFGIPKHIRGEYQRKVAAAHGKRLSAEWVKTDAFLSILEGMLDRESGVWFNNAVAEFGLVLSCLPKRVRENVKMFLARVHAMLWARDVFGSRHSFDFDVKIWGTRSRACRKRDTADWTRFCFERCSDLLFEAMRIGIYNDNYSIVYTCLLQTAEPRNWRKVSSMMDEELLEHFRFQPMPGHLAMAATLCWRAGAYSRAARHLDETGGVEGMRSLGAFQPLWRAYHRRLHATPTYQGWLWPNLLIAIDIYGRAGRWVEAAEAFSTLAYGDDYESSLNSRGGASSVGSVASDGTGTIATPQAALHPAPLAQAVTACIKLGQIEEAAAALSGMQTSLCSDAAAAGPGGSGRRISPGATIGAAPGNGGDGYDEAGWLVAEEAFADEVGEDSTEEFVYTGGQPDAAWVEATVRAFVGENRRDLASAVLSPEICKWTSVDAVARQQLRQYATGKDGGDDVRWETEGPRRPLDPPEKKPIATPTAPGMTEGAEEASRALGTGVEVAGAARSLSFVDPLAASTAPGSEISRSDAEGSENVPGDEYFGYDVATGPDTTYNDGARIRREQICAEGLRWLASSEGQPEAYDVAGGAFSTASSELSDPLAPTPPLPPTTGSLGADSRAAGGANQLLRSRTAAVSAEVILAAARRAWASDACRVEQATRDIGKCAALALYEAGVETGRLSANRQWASIAGGVVDLSGAHFSRSQAVGTGALNVVLRDMLRKYAFGEELDRHVHHPGSDLIVIVDVAVSSVAVSSVRAILWLLGSEFSHYESGALSPPELLGLTPAIYPTPQVSKPLRDVKRQIMDRPRKSGVVLCLPRLQLQRWLLEEGRARRGSDGVDWSPPWLELEVDGPPLLPVHMQSDTRSRR